MADKKTGQENSDCECPYSCERHGKCTKCQEYHHRHNEKTYCGK